MIAPATGAVAVRRAAIHIRFRSFASAAFLLLSISGCQTFSARQKEAVYTPTEGVLEAVAVLRRHVPDDTYRFQIGRAHV